jgi:hypothetical protein
MKQLDYGVIIIDTDKSDLKENDYILNIETKMISNLNYSTVFRRLEKNEYKIIAAEKLLVVSKLLTPIEVIHVMLRELQVEKLANEKFREKEIACELPEGYYDFPANQWIKDVWIDGYCSQFGIYTRDQMALALEKMEHNFVIEKDYGVTLKKTVYEIIESIEYPMSDCEVEIEVLEEGVKIVKFLSFIN